MVTIYHGSRCRNTVTKAETKVCALCAALNYHKNTECLVCGWRGVFGNDPAVTDYQWQRLMERYEEVRLEHLIVHGRQEIGELGVMRKSSLWERVRAAWEAVRMSMQTNKPAKAAPPRSNSAVPPL